MSNQERRSAEIGREGREGTVRADPKDDGTAIAVSAMGRILVRVDGQWKRFDRS